MQVESPFLEHNQLNLPHAFKPQTFQKVLKKHTHIESIHGTLKHAHTDNLDRLMSALEHDKLISLQAFKANGAHRCVQYAQPPNTRNRNITTVTWGVFTGMYLCIYTFRYKNIPFQCKAHLHLDVYLNHYDKRFMRSLFTGIRMCTVYKAHIHLHLYLIRDDCYDECHLDILSTSEHCGILTSYKTRCIFSSVRASTLHVTLSNRYPTGQLVLTRRIHMTFVCTYSQARCSNPQW
jgi:hypothetical protein